MLEHVLQALVVALVVVKLLAIGAHKRWGWAVAIAAEAPWIALALMWRSWGMVALSLLYGGISARNYRAWAPASPPAQ